MVKLDPPRLRIVVWLCTGLLIAMLAGRLLWTASHTETGLETLRAQWVDAVRELAFRPRVPVSVREPIEQGEFWNGEVDRVLEAAPRDAKLTMGAALVLDSPATGYIGRYIRRIHNYPGGGKMPDLDYDGIKQANKAFEKACKTRCLDLAARATKLAPTNLDWWRLRALLLWRHAFYSHDSTPRDSDWETVQEECAVHDPDNSLYDYLAAYFLWEASSEIDYSGNTDRLVVHDQATFDRGREFIRRGQSKPLFVLGDAGFTAIASFVAASGIPKIEQPDVVNSRSVANRRALLLRDITRLQGQLADEAKATGDFRRAVSLHRENLRLYDQFAAAGRSAGYDNTLLVCRAVTAAELVKIANDFPNEFDAAELNEIQTIAERASIDQAVVQQAAQSLATSQQQLTGVSFNGDASTVVLFLAVAALASSVIALALLGLIAMLLARGNDSSQTAKITVAEHVLLLLASLGVTVTVFGLAPAGMISEQAQAWGLTILLVGAPLAIVAWALWNWRRPTRFQFSLRTLLICFLVVSLLLTLAAVLRPVVVSLHTFPFQLKIPALSCHSWNAAVLETLIRQVASWLWPLSQWTLYLGPYITIAIWATLVATLLQLKIQLRARDSQRTVPMLRSRLRQFGQSLRGPCCLLGAIALMAYLILAPPTLQLVEQNFQSQIAFARNPEDHWTKVERAVQAVRANPQLMAEIIDASKFECPAAAGGELQ